MACVSDFRIFLKMAHGTSYPYPIFTAPEIGYSKTVPRPWNYHSRALHIEVTPFGRGLVPLAAHTYARSFRRRSARSFSSLLLNDAYHRSSASLLVAHGRYARVVAATAGSSRDVGSVPLDP